LQSTIARFESAIMKFSAGLLLPVLIGAATAAASDGTVYIFQGQESPSTSSNPPALTPEEARLVFAQRLGVPQYHSIGDASEKTLSSINTFGGRQESIFQDSGRDKAAELVLLVQGFSPKTAQPLIDAWSSYKPAFTILDAPSAKSNSRLIEDLQRQVGTVQDCVLDESINPFNDKCWNGEAKAIFMDLTTGKVQNRKQFRCFARANSFNQVPGIDDLMAAQGRLIEFAKYNEMNVMVVLMPESGTSRNSKPYGPYEMPSQTPLRRRQAEEPMTDLPAASSAAFKSKQVMTSNTSEPLEPITGVPPVCHSSIDSCISSTNNCSGHGACYKKSGSAEGEDASPACYACGCGFTEENFLEGEDGKPAYRITYWGGAACQKKDVSGPFWLFATFTVVMVGLVSWAIGMLFSIGEEKLPGVIGAGVSSKAR
jgi:hypothetical protein